MRGNALQDAAEGDEEEVFMPAIVSDAPLRSAAKRIALRGSRQANAETACRESSHA
jgi:hypothetical protein